MLSRLTINGNALVRWGRITEAGICLFDNRKSGKVNALPLFLLLMQNNR